jgi:NADPH:quinone reductase-like Zn-dependent oxidoreductase
VVTVADFRGAHEYCVAFSRGDGGRALYVLSQIGDLVESGRFTLPEVQSFPLADVAEAHRVSENGHVRAKFVLTMD